MPKHRAAGMIFALACTGGLARTADAQVAGSWIGAATGQWTHSVNWTSNPQFPSANGTAIFNAGPASVSLGTTIQLQHLKLDTPSQITLTGNSLSFINAAPLIEVPRSKLNPQGVHYYTGHSIPIGINTGSSTLQITGPGAVVLGGSNAFTASLLLNNGADLGVLSSAALGSSFGSILMDNATLRTISTTGTISTTIISIPRAIQVFPGGGTLAAVTAPLRITQQIFGGGPLTFTGPAGVQLDSDISWAGDARVVGGGTTGLTIGNLGGIRFFNNLTVGATVDVAYSSGAQDRLGAGTITMRGGTLSLNGLGSSESIGTIVLAGGQDTIRLGGTSGTFNLSATQINRTDRATLRLIADGLGGTSGFGRMTRINLSNATNLPLIGGGGGTGSNNASIIPFAHAQTVFANGYTFVTHGANGLRALDMSEYHVDFPVDLISDANVRTSGVTNVNDPRTINSLLHGGLPQAISGSATLTITSGAMMGAGAGSFAGFISCPVDFGSAEGFVTNMSVLGPLHGTNGVTINGTASLNTSASTYTGPTTINSGTLIVNLNADLVPGVPGPFGMDTSPIELMGRGTGAVLQVNSLGRTFGRAIHVNADSELLRGNEPALRTTSPTTFTSSIELTGPLRLDSTSPMTLAGPITGSGRLVVATPSTVTLSGTSSFAGGVHFQNGTLIVAADQALGAGTLYMGDGSIGANNATFSMGASFLTPRTLANPIVLSDTIVLTSAPGPTAGTLLLNGPLNLNGDLRSIVASGARVHFNGPISDGELRFGGEGTLSGNNSQRGTYILVSPTNFSRVTATHSNALGGVDAKLTQVGSFGFSSGLTRLELRGGLDIPAHQLLLHDELRNGEGNNIWRGPINANGNPSFNIVVDSFTAMSGINGAGVGGSITKQGDGTLHTKYFRAEQRLNIAAGTARVLANGTDAATSSVASLTLAGAPDAWQVTFDLADNALVIHDSTALATIQNQLLSGYANGSWNGTGIQSSAAANDPQHHTGIGLALGGDLFTTFPATFAGVSVNADSALMRYTLYGDANLDRAVNITDFALLAANFNTPTIWSRGDFNYDGITNISDFSLLAANFNQMLPTDLPRQSIPEPTAVVFVALASWMLRRAPARV